MVNDGVLRGMDRGSTEREVGRTVYGGTMDG
jgi:hypothetical protein